MTDFSEFEAENSGKEKLLKEKISDYVQQMLSICALQQAIIRNIQREVENF